MVICVIKIDKNGTVKKVLYKILWKQKKKKKRIRKEVRIS